MANLRSSRDPQERGYVDIVEYYDDSGKPIRREVRKNSACQTAWCCCEYPIR